MKPTITIAAYLTLAAALAASSGCDRKQSDSPAAVKPTAPGGQANEDHAHGQSGEHLPPPTGAGHGGSVMQLGNSTIGPFEVKATRDQGEVVAGKDAPIDVTVTLVPGSAVKATAVRFWIGTEDAKGSVRARAEIENPAEPNRWHTHAEVPNPIPAGSRLWVEIEDDKGGTNIGGFDLRM